MSKEHHDEDVVKKLKRIYRETVGYTISNHVGSSEGLEDVLFADIGLDESEIDEFIGAVNEEFGTEIVTETAFGTFGDFITLVEKEAKLA